MGRKGNKKFGHTKICYNGASRNRVQVKECTLPKFAAAPQSVVWDSFLAAWAEYDEGGIVIEI